jgi:hypothetical protein
MARACSPSDEKVHRVVLGLQTFFMKLARAASFSGDGIFRISGDENGLYATAGRNQLKGQSAAITVG